jgi:S-DNA-T family DNA segregation ATPase FtsK/SpoIIIE
MNLDRRADAMAKKNKRKSPPKKTSSKERPRRNKATGKDKAKAAGAGKPARAVRGGHQHEIFGVILALAAVIVLLALASFDPADPVLDDVGARAHNLVGLVGAHLADGLLAVFGAAAFLLVIGLGYAAAVAFARGALPIGARKAVGFVALLLQGTALVQIAAAEATVLGHAPGGLLGEVLGGLCVSLLSTTGSVAVLAAGVCLALIATTGFSLVASALGAGRGLAALARAAGRGLGWLGRRAGRAAAAAARALGGWLAAQGREFVHTLRQRSPAVQPQTVPPSDSLPPLTWDEPPAAEAAAAQPAAAAARDSEPAAEPAAAAAFLAPPVSCPPPLGRREPVVVTDEPPPADCDGPTEMDEAPVPAAARPAAGRAGEQAQPPAAAAEVEPPATAPGEDSSPPAEPEIVIPKARRRSSEEADQPEAADARDASPDWGDFELPSIDMLDSADYEADQAEEIDRDELHHYARRLERKLADYGIKGQVSKIMPGPVVTMYEYAPGPGIKVAKIAGLSQDLALALEAVSVRIIAPIPGRAVVGIEVSNKKRQVVYAREIIGHKTFRRSKSKLTLALGKDIEGEAYVTDLNKMPHLLVAGATGTGKSVALNSMITSILYKATPEDVRFIMVDPKVLELSLYEGIPHLLLPVVTDPRKAQAALQWTVEEMERRIHILHGAGVRNLDSFNRKAEKLARQREQAAAERGAAAEEPARKKKIVVIDKTAEAEADEEMEVEVDAAEEDAAPGEMPERLEKMPHIVVVIDELADLMMTAGREVETNIARIAQKARAAGIHLIVATQRPSVNVITGLIKANLPARVSFRVASKVDSRTILDANGAEALLGNGDMLFNPPTSSELLRVHGAYITEEEIEKVVEHLKAQAEPVFDESILAAAERADEPEAAEGGEDDPDDDLYDQAVRIVAEMGQASTSMVQRKLRIGYNRAARLIERMEREGIVGPPDGSRPRKVLIQNH